MWKFTFLVFCAGWRPCEEQGLETCLKRRGLPHLRRKGFRGGLQGSRAGLSKWSGPAVSLELLLLPDCFLSLFAHEAGIIGQSWAASNYVQVTWRDSCPPKAWGMDNHRMYHPHLGVLREGVLLAIMPGLPPAKRGWGSPSLGVWFREGAVFFDILCLYIFFPRNGETFKS